MVTVPGLFFQLFPWLVPRPLQPDTNGHFLTHNRCAAEERSREYREDGRGTRAGRELGSPPACQGSPARVRATTGSLRLCLRLCGHPGKLALARVGVGGCTSHLLPEFYFSTADRGGGLGAGGGAPSPRTAPSIRFTSPPGVGQRWGTRCAFWAPHTASEPFS